MPEPFPGSASLFVERELHSRLEALEQLFDADLLSFSGPILFGVDDFFRDAVEAKKGMLPSRQKLVVILTTDGGYIEVVQRVVETLRRHYTLVDFVIPNYAYSAGTILVMSGDAIHMDYYSRLGPIDPQVETRDGIAVPALGYLERYNALIKKAVDGEITTAEVQLLIDGFNQAELYKYEHARELSITLLKEWLVAYKFKDWKTTRTRRKRVTVQMKRSRAAAIARELSKTQRWHTHGQGISMEVLSRDLQLLIDDFGKESALSDAIRAYHDLLSDYMVKMRMTGVIHCGRTYRPFMTA
jgi:hypothetical protein